MEGAWTLRTVGRDAVLVEVDDAHQALSLAAFLRSSRVGATEVVPGARTVLLDGVGSVADVEHALHAWSPDVPGEPGELVEIAVRYDGADLDFVADRWGTDRGGVVRRHTAIEFVSAFCGFAPGFAYLAGLPDDLAVPRLESPRPSVPAGAVALAGPWCGVYPTSSPGGWRLIGTTDAVLWDASRQRPAMLSPGTRVRFRDDS